MPAYLSDNAFQRYYRNTEIFLTSGEINYTKQYSQN